MYDTWNPTYTDYAITLSEPALKNGGVRHTYWDIAMPVPFDDLLKGWSVASPTVGCSVAVTVGMTAAS